MFISHNLLQLIEKKLHVKVAKTHTPKQGMDGEVFFITTTKGHEFAVKISQNAENEILTLNLIKEYNLDIPIPKLFSYFIYENKTILVLEKIHVHLLEQIPHEDKSKCIQSMIINLKKIHSIQSDCAGLMTSENSTWKQLLLDTYSKKEFDWNNISQRKGVNKNLIQETLNHLQSKLNELHFESSAYSLLHTDFNQRNLFIDPKTYEVAGIIDWNEAIFGDPLYDFARVRMFIWHFNFGADALKHYYELLQLTDEEKQYEEFYFVHQIFKYIGWYSEVNSEFTNARLKMHQEYLEEYYQKNITI